MSRLSPLAIASLILAGSGVAFASLGTATPERAESSCRLTTIHRIGGHTLQVQCGSLLGELDRTAKLQSVLLRIIQRLGPGDTVNRGTCRIPRRLPGHTNHAPRYTLGEYEEALGLGLKTSSRFAQRTDQRDLVEGARQEIRENCPELTDTLEEPGHELALDEFRVDPKSTLYVGDGHGGFRTTTWIR